MNRFIAGLALAAVSCVVVAGMCGCAGTHDSAAPLTAERLVGTWEVATLEGQKVAGMLARGAKPPSLTFAADGAVSGFSGVNRLSGKLDMQGVPRGEFLLGPLAMTRMAGPPEAMEVERRFTQLLDRVDSVKIDGRTLILSDGAEPQVTLTRGE